MLMMIRLRGIVLEHRFKNVILYSGLEGYVSRYALGNIVPEEQWCKETLCMDKENCSYVQDIVWATMFMHQCYENPWQQAYSIGLNTLSLT